MQDGEMTGMANSAAVCGVIARMRWVKRGGLGECSSDQQHDQERVPGAAPQWH